MNAVGLTLVNAVRDVRRSWWMQQHRHRFTRPPDARPRLLVDLSVLARSDAGTGIQRVVRAIWHQLRHDAGPFEPVPVAATRRHGYALVRLRSDGSFAERPVAVGSPAAAGPGDVFVGLDLAAHALPRQQRQLQAWRRAGARIEVVVYDLLPVTHPQYFEPRTSRVFAQWLTSIDRHADRLLCISGHVAGEVERWRAAHPRPGAVRPALARLPMGADIASSAPSEGRSQACRETLARIGDRPFILMVGTIEPRKAYDVALDAFEYWWAHPDAAPPLREAPLLVIAGRRGWRTEALQARLAERIAAGHPLMWFDNASDEVIEELYRRASGLLLTSHAEGYGLPVAEACHWRCPTLARDLPPLREMAGGGRRLFRDDRPVPLIREVARLINDPPPFAADPPPDWADAAQTVRRLLAQGATSCRA